MGFGPSPMEIAVIAVIALIVLGPARLPEMARSLGKGMREMRGAFSGEGGDDSSRKLGDADEDDDENDEDETKALDLDAEDDFDEDDDLDFSSSSSDVASPGDPAETSSRSTDDAKPAASA